MKRTYQASKVRRARTHGFLVRMKTRGGRAVINARRAKGRKRLRGLSPRRAAIAARARRDGRCRCARSVDSADFERVLGTRSRARAARTSPCTMSRRPPAAARRP